MPSSPMPSLVEWKDAAKNIIGSNLSADTRAQIDAISKEVAIYHSQYTVFESKLEPLAGLVQESKALQASKGDARRIQALNEQITSLRASLDNAAKDIQADAPKMANVVGRFKTVIEAVAPKAGRSPLSEAQQEGLRDCVDWMGRFSELLNTSRGGWLDAEAWINTALDQGEKYVLDPNRPKSGPPKLKLKAPGGSSGSGA
ncbi:MAG: hypothetical protein IV093_20320 [Rubrivivax sp.]|nr:hypothetical protein [Rubrivivax sp.]